MLQFSRRFYGISRALLNYILITDQIQIANTGYYLQFYLNIRDISIFCLKYHKNNVEVYYSLVVGIGKLHYILCLRIIRCLYCSADNCMFLQPAPARINKFIIKEIIKKHGYFRNQLNTSDHVKGVVPSAFCTAKGLIKLIIGVLQGRKKTV